MPSLVWCQICYAPVPGEMARHMAARHGGPAVPDGPETTLGSPDVEDDTDWVGLLNDAAAAWPAETVVHVRTEIRRPHPSPTGQAGCTGRPVRRSRRP